MRIVYKYLSNATASLHSKLRLVGAQTCYLTSPHPTHPSCRLSQGTPAEAAAQRYITDASLLALVGALADNKDRNFPGRPPVYNFWPMYSYTPDKNSSRQCTGSTGSTCTAASRANLGAGSTAGEGCRRDAAAAAAAAGRQEPDAAGSAGSGAACAAQLGYSYSAEAANLLQPAGAQIKGMQSLARLLHRLKLDEQVWGAVLPAGC
jgi:hypothetical protein